MSKENKTKDPYQRRVTVIFPEDLYQRFTKHFEWGERNRVLVNVTEWLLDKMDKFGPEALYILLRNGDLNALARMQEKESTKEGENA